MRKIYRMLALGGIMISLSSCGNSWLNLDPSDGNDVKNAITDVRSADVVLTGIYDGLQGASNRVSYYGMNMFAYGDVRGEDMQTRTLNSRGGSFYRMDYTHSDAPQIWKIPYNVILRANTLLEAVAENKVSDASEAQLANYQSEALVVRALAHFDLCRIYGNPYNVDNGASLGIPITLTRLAADAQKSRNTVAEVYTQVIKDLEDAISIGGLSKKKNYGYVNEWFAKGLLAKVYLYKGDNVKAFKYAKDVIDNSPYSLWTNEEYVSGWKTSDKGRKEMIFELVNKSKDDWTDREGIANLMDEDGYADIIATQSFIDLLAQDPNDIRNKVLIHATSRLDKDGKETNDLYVEFKEKTIFVNKFPKDESGEWRLNSLPILRLSEVYLIAAEAAVKDSKAGVAAGYLNAIAKRANPEMADLTAAETTLERISLERRKEFVGEGHRFFDAMRNNEKIVRYTSEADKGHHNDLKVESRQFDRTYFRALLPIPSSETNANPVLRAQQNPGY